MTLQIENYRKQGTLYLGGVLWSQKFVLTFFFWSDKLSVLVLPRMKDKCLLFRFQMTKNMANEYNRYICVQIQVSKSCLRIYGCRNY